LLVASNVATIIFAEIFPVASGVATKVFFSIAIEMFL
jgi:hypothetical protein